jgi:DNA mismatch endonuclease Vsr
MRSVRSGGNRSTELCLRLALVREGVRHWKVAPEELPGRPDFYFPHARLAVFVDGCFWHGCVRCGHFPRTNRRFWRAKILRNRQRDTVASLALRASGIKVLRFWEHDLSDGPQVCVRKIKTALKQKNKRL